MTLQRKRYSDCSALCCSAVRPNEADDDTELGGEARGEVGAKDAARPEEESGKPKDAVDGEDDPNPEIVQPAPPEVAV